MSKKKILVEILKTTAGVGKQGEQKEVNIVHARNMLIPQGIAKEISNAGNQASPKKETNDDLQNNRHSIVETLNGKTIEIAVSSHGQKIASHFDGHDVVKKIKQSYSIKLPATMIIFEGVKHPKKIGSYDFHITLSDDAYIRMHLIITAK